MDGPPACLKHVAARANTESRRLGIEGEMAGQSWERGYTTVSLLSGGGATARLEHRSLRHFAQQRRASLDSHLGCSHCMNIDLARSVPRPKH